MEIILDNLIKNSIEAMQNSKTKSLSVSIASTDNGVRLEVSDTGIGMSQEDIAQACQPFFTTKTHQKGTGLGMAICNAIIKSTNGSFDIESQPGKGTVMTIILPLKIKAMAECEG